MKYSEEEKVVLSYVFSWIFTFLFLLIVIPFLGEGK